MNIKAILLTLAAGLALTTTPLRAEYTPPSEGQLDQMMANPKMVAPALKGATGKQAADLLKRIIDRVIAADLNASQKSYMIAYYSARFAFLLPASELNSFASEVIALAPAEVMPSVLSGFSLGGGGSADFIAHVRELVQDNDAYVNALMTPRASLTNPIHDRLVRTLSASQTLPPSVTDSLPPPGDADGDGTSDDGGASTPPPVPPTYDGQG